MSSRALSELALTVRHPSAQVALALRGDVDAELAQNYFLHAEAAQVLTAKKLPATVTRDLASLPVASHDDVLPALLKDKRSVVQAALLYSTSNLHEVASAALASGSTLSAKVAKALLFRFTNLRVAHREQLARTGDHRFVLAFAFDQGLAPDEVSDWFSNVPDSGARVMVEHWLARYPQQAHSFARHDEYSTVVAGSSAMGLFPDLARELSAKWLEFALENRFALLALLGNPMTPVDVTNAVFENRTIRADAFWFRPRSEDLASAASSVADVPTDVADVIGRRLISPMEFGRRMRLGDAPLLALNPNWSDAGISAFIDRAAERLDHDRDTDLFVNAQALRACLSTLAGRGFSAAAAAAANVTSSPVFGFDDAARVPSSRVFDCSGCAAVNVRVSSQDASWVRHHHVLVDAFGDDVARWSLAWNLLESFHGSLPDFANVVCDVTSSTA